MAGSSWDGSTLTLPDVLFGDSTQWAYSELRFERNGVSSYGFFLKDGVDFNEVLRLSLEPAVGQVSVRELQTNTIAGSKTFGFGGELNFNVGYPDEEIGAWIIALVGAPESPLDAASGDFAPKVVNTFSLGTPINVLKSGYFGTSVVTPLLHANEPLSITTDEYDITIAPGGGNQLLLSNDGHVDLIADAGDLTLSTTTSGDIVLTSAGGDVTTTARVSASAYITSTTSPSVANIGANSCGTSAASIAGTDNAFAITVGATAGTACRVTFDTTAPTTWACVYTNQTTANLARQTAATATTSDVTGTFVAGDVLVGVCFAR